MRAHRIATATMLVLAVGGWTALGSGVAFADTDPGGGKARARGGSDTVGGVFLQNTAQSSRQNNNCNNPNAVSEEMLLSGGRAEGRCVTGDGSLTAFSRIQPGPADAEGGSSALDLGQQNTAQRGQQNNNCHNPNESEVEVTGGRVEGRCTDRDFSVTKHTRVEGGSARAEGGSSADAEVNQQNVAQSGRQNNNCNHLNSSGIEVTGGRVEGRCTDRDFSVTKHGRVKGGGARAEGSSGTGGSAEVDQQNVAQSGRQNNNCNNLNDDSFLEVTEGRVGARCGTQDASFSWHTDVRGGGARAEGSGVPAVVEQVSIAQEGRQNNNCNNPNFGDETLEVTGGRLDAHCGAQDASYSQHTHVRGGGARAEGGFSGDTGGGDLNEQNVAQEGRQNNNCNNPNESADFHVTGGRAGVRCGNKDASFSKHARVKGGGARAEGGSATVANAGQQNIAQEGRQNNTCHNPNITSIEVTGSRSDARCGTKDGSFNKHTLVKGGGTRAEAGSSTAAVVEQQNVAQEGRQNNACANPNATDITVERGRSQVGCRTVDHSANLGTADIGGGAQAEGGSSTADLFQQNTAQEGRQNNDCASPNNLTLTTTGSRTHAQCTTVDRSTNIATINR
ncbi:hypothetical protein [Streptomyces sp. NPDC051776]|uniref:hypothetical protein n=1 Tax=Streptomyces sp. NPDC051776 TaxID=3155414 RepID=UPI00342C20E4